MKCLCDAPHWILWLRSCIVYELDMQPAIEQILFTILIILVTGLKIDHQGSWNGTPKNPSGLVPGMPQDIKKPKK